MNFERRTMRQGLAPLAPEIIAAAKTKTSCGAAFGIKIFPMTSNALQTTIL